MSYLEPCWAILSDLGGHLGLSEALLEPSWAILDALATRGPARPGPGEGVGGGVKLLPWRKPSRPLVNPSPKGKKGFLEEGRKISLDRLRPEGWRDWALVVRSGIVFFLWLLR